MNLGGNAPRSGALQVHSRQGCVIRLHVLIDELPAAIMQRWIIFCAFLSAKLFAQSADVRRVLTGTMPNDEFGSFVAKVGDFDQDGVADVAVSAPFEYVAGSPVGVVRVFSGATGTVLRTIMGTPTAGLGPVAAVGDIDTDGIPDLIIGTPQIGSTGGVGGGAVLFSGLTGSAIRTFAGTASNDYFGTCVASAGDVDGDGKADILIGTGFSPSSGAFGYAKLYSGSTGALLMTYTGILPGARLGASVCGSADLNADGVRDVLIGSIGDSTFGSNTGRVTAYSGLNGTVLWHALGATSQRFGYSIASIGDQNGDGKPEVAAGSYVPNGTGVVRILNGQNGSTIRTLTGPAVGDAFGHVVANAGDLDGDGFSDIAIGLPRADSQGLIDNGAVHAVSGQTGALLRAWTGDTQGRSLGYWVSSAGDSNIDGFSDIIAGGGSTTGLIGQAVVLSVIAADRYGVLPSASQELALGFDLGPVGSRWNGSVRIGAATPMATIVVAASAHSGDTVIAGIRVLIDLAPENLLTFTLPTSGAGEAYLPLSLRTPGLAGVSVRLQCFEFAANFAAGVTSSNAMTLLFGP